MIDPVTRAGAAASARWSGRKSLGEASTNIDDEPTGCSARRLLSNACMKLSKSVLGWVMLAGVVGLTSACAASDASIDEDDGDGDGHDHGAGEPEREGESSESVSSALGSASTATIRPSPTWTWTCSVSERHRFSSCTSMP